MKQRGLDHPLGKPVSRVVRGLVVLAALASVGAASGARAQGFIYFSTRVSGTVVAHVYGVGDATQLSGNTPEETPAGTQIYFGARLAGAGFSAQLYGGPVGTLEDALVAIGGPSEFRVGPTLAGTPLPQTLSVPGVPAGATGVFQVRAWNNAGGTLVTWDAAAIRGKSALFNVANLGDDVNTLPAVMADVRSFNILPVPPTGACCAPTGTCTVATQLGCAGNWLGAGTVCSPNPCPPPSAFGACCFRNASCRILGSARCTALRGTYLGDGSVCSPDPCLRLQGRGDDPSGSSQESWGHIKSRYR
jgi:hypothetical protein